MKRTFSDVTRFRACVHPWIGVRYSGPRLSHPASMSSGRFPRCICEGMEMWKLVYRERGDRSDERAAPNHALSLIDSNPRVLGKLDVG